MSTSANPLRSRRPSFSSPQQPSTSEFGNGATRVSFEDNMIAGGTAATKARELLARLDVENTSPLLGVTTESTGRMSSPSLYQRASSPSSQPPLANGANGGGGARNLHNRMGSLTSACPPVTALNTAGLVTGGLEGPASPILATGNVNGNGRSWKYDWSGMDDKDDRSSSGSSKSPTSPTRSHGHGTLTGGMARQFDRLLALPTNLLSLLLAPILQQSPPHPIHTRPLSPSPSLTSIASPLNRLVKENDKAAKDKLSSSTNSANDKRRWPLLIHLLVMAYLAFSVIQFSLGVLDHFGIVERGKSSVKQVGSGIDWKKALEEKTGGIINLKRAEEESGGGRDSWGVVRRFGGHTQAKQNIVTGMSNTYRFAKMHEKVHWDTHDEIEPFVFHASTTPTEEDVTACLYSNEAWLDLLPTFVETWQGPVSLVFELSHSRHSLSERQDVLNRIEDLRRENKFVRELVDWHFVGTPTTVLDRTLNKTRERLIFNPVAGNFHLNLARFFAKTDIIFQVSDARVLPSKYLRKRLLEGSVRDIVLERGDAVVVPTFGFMRLEKLLNPHEIREKLDLPQSGYWDGIGSEEFEQLGKEALQNTLDSLPIPIGNLPTKKSHLVNLVSTKSTSNDYPVALYDARWDLNHGPTNWYLWRKSATDSKLLESPELGGGSGLGLDGALGGGNDVFKVTDYDLHYSPNLVFSKQGQPWCTERFERLSAACVYQLYLTGAEMWVLPDEWSFTLEGIEKDEHKKEDPTEKLKNSISSRLYGKFHQEACMHYGREFLSVQMWDSDKAQHLRTVCARTLGTWGMGDA